MFTNRDALSTSSDAALADSTLALVPGARIVQTLGQTAGGWVRKTLTDAQTAAIAVDDTNNRFPASVPSVTWTAPTAGNNTTGLAICYDSDTTAGTDANIIVLVHCDFVVTADGNDVVLNAGDFFRAS